MIGILRFVGVVNAAVWLGASVFFAAFILPGVFSADMHQLIGGDDAVFKQYAGSIALVLFKRFFALQYVCGMIALVHLVVEKLYQGRMLPRFGTAIVMGVFCLGLAGGIIVRPHMEDLRRTMYSDKATVAQKDAAKASFTRWHVTSNLAVLVMIGGLLAHLMRVTRQEDTSRYVNFSKIWG